MAEGLAFDRRWYQVLPVDGAVYLNGGHGIVDGWTLVALCQRAGLEPYLRETDMTNRWTLLLAGYELFFAGVALSIGAAGPAAFFALLAGLCLGRWASNG